MKSINCSILEFSDAAAKKNLLFGDNTLKAPLHLAKFAIANIGQVIVQVFTQYFVQVFHFSGIFI